MRGRGKERGAGLAEVSRPDGRGGGAEAEDKMGAGTASSLLPCLAGGEASSRRSRPTSDLRVFPALAARVGPGLGLGGERPAPAGRLHCSPRELKDPRSWKIFFPSFSRLQDAC